MANSPTSSGSASSASSPYMPYGASGGGGAGGRYFFTDLNELDSIIAGIEAEIEDVRSDDRYFDQAIR